MEILLLALSLGCAGYSTVLVGNDMQFGMFAKVHSVQSTTVCSADEPFGSFDTTHVVHYQKEREKEDHQLDYLLQLEAALRHQERSQKRVQKKAARSQQGALATENSDYVCYKLRNRLYKKEIPTRSISGSHQQPHKGAQTQDAAQALTVSKSIERQSLSMPERDVDIMSYLNAHKIRRRKQRCTQVRECAIQYLDMVKTLIDMQTDMIISLKKELEEVRCLAAAKPSNCSDGFDYPSRPKPE